MTRLPDGLPIALVEALLDHAADTMFYVKDTALRYVSVNSTLLRLSGRRDKRDVLGQTATQVFGRPYYTAQDEQVIRTGVALTGQLELYLRPGGQTGWCLTTKLPLLGPCGSVIGLCGISQVLPVTRDPGARYPRLAEALDTIQQRYAEPLRVRTLATSAGLSEDQFSRTIQRLFGLTPKQLLMKTRMGGASTLLLTTNLDVGEIATACGYADHSAFARQFQKVAGLTPSEFRAAGTAGDRRPLLKRQA
ncbi:AraC family transcriptional regulator [Deinococcus sp. KSM4-11]|uniref:helix-turn-helix domain-containing protein n=1 Tax=Deinococcus sp. KSM4-11 TaxID=2568654 RepID=UPI0010A4AC49|nr:helix-turn-helix domain-containing protein [Deinococcus sp. KSM4-11]THF85444.1 AraC family transcriptional regulator [Deinococcus sp. KSM4-11]